MNLSLVCFDAQDPDSAKPINDWDTATVKEWVLDLEGVPVRILLTHDGVDTKSGGFTLKLMDFQLHDRVATALEEHQISGPDLLHLDSAKLEKLGVTSISEQSRILEAVGLISGEREVISGTHICRCPPSQCDCSPPVSHNLERSSACAQICALQSWSVRCCCCGASSRPSTTTSERHPSMFHSFHSQVYSTLLQFYSILSLNIRGQPVPFFYIHLLFFISALYLPMFAYSLAMETTIGVPARCESVSQVSCYSQTMILHRT